MPADAGAAIVTHKAAARRNADTLKLLPFKGVVQLRSGPTEVTYANSKKAALPRP